MSRSVTSNSFVTKKGILMFAEPYTGVARTFYPNESCVVTTPGGRKYIPAGTIYPANDATAKGVVYYDVDVTNGEADGSLLTEAHIKTVKLPKVPSAAAKAAMPNIIFYPLETITVTGSAVPTAVATGTASGTEVVAIYSLVGTTFRDEAETLSNWTINGETTVKITISSIKVSDNRKFVTIKGATTAAAVAGDVTVVPKAACTGTGDVPTAATTVITVA